MGANDLQKTKKDMEEENLGFENVNLHEHSTEQLMIALELANKKFQCIAEAQKKRNGNICHGNLAFSQLPFTKSSSDFSQPPPSAPPSPITGYLRLLLAEETSGQDLAFQDKILDGYPEESGEFLDFESGLDMNAAQSPIRDLDDEDSALLDRLEESSNQGLGLGFQNNNCNNIDITDSLQTATPLHQHGSFQALPPLPVIDASDCNQNIDAKNDTLLEIQEPWNHDFGFLGNLFAEESGQGSTASGSISIPATELSEFKC